MKNEPGLRPSIDDFEDAAAAFEDAITAADLGTQVPSCPGWTVDDLVRHVGLVHAWARNAVVEGRSTSPKHPERLGRDQLVHWYHTQARRLVETIASDLTAPAWIFGEGKGSAAWWLRRQVHEVVLHTWDAVTSCGRQIDLDPELAWDAVREAAEVFYPRQVQLGRVGPLPGALVLIPTDLPVDSVRIGDGQVHEVRAPAADLMLMVWQRRTFVGDPETAELLARPLTP